ncbi:MAG: hypothetical protein ACI89L_001234 [Phycisphaerales bacterium]|jgi:hypothetical protein
MANKMFYTVEEAAAKLGMSVEEVQGLGDSGQLQEFRDRDRLMFKREQVDLLAGHEGGDDEIDEITLAESGELEPLSLSSSGSGSAFSSASGTDTGVSIFDPDDSGADANADTLVTAFGDAGASGSGLANMAFESDDTSLGGDLLADLGDSSADSAMGSAMGGSSMSESAAGSLFEGDTSEPDYAGSAAAAAPMMITGDGYDGPGSGIAAGAALAMTVVLLGAMSVMLLSLTGAGSAALFEGISDNTVYMVLGGGIALVGIFAAIGFVAMRKG